MCAVAFLILPLVNSCERINNGTISHSVFVLGISRGKSDLPQHLLSGHKREDGEYAGWQLGQAKKKVPLPKSQLRT